MRPALFPAVAFALGVWVGVLIPPAPWIFLGATALLGAGCLYLYARAGAHLALLLGFCALGAGLAELHARVVLPRSVSPEGGPAVLEGVVERLAPGPDGTAVELAVTHVLGPAAEPARFRALIFGRGDLGPLEVGQRVRVPTTLREPRGPGNPGEWDGRPALRRRAVAFVGSFEPARLVRLSEASPWRTWVRSRQRALETATRRLAPTDAAASLYLTLAAGQRAALGKELEAQFARSGLSHVLSVSGLHVAALALLAVRLLRWAAVHALASAAFVDARRLSALAAIPVVWGYALFTGGQPPALRSAVMASGLLLGWAAWRRADPLNGLALSALLLLAASPSALADLSLQLSLVCVAALVLLGPAVRELLPVRPPDPTARGRLAFLAQKAREAALNSLCASAAAIAASFPLVAAAFHQVSLAGLLANVVCLPLCAVLTALAAAGAALSAVSTWAATPVLWLGAQACRVLCEAAALFAAMPGAAWNVPSLGPFPTALYSAGLVALVIAPGRWRLAALAAPAAVAVRLLWVGLPRPGLAVTFLAVGHGDSVLLSSRGAHALVDGGGAVGSEVGRRTVLPYLHERGVRALTLAALSHAHADHALGLAEVLEALPTGRVWLPAGGEENALARRVEQAAGPATVERVDATAPPFQLGEAVLRVHSPPPDALLLEGINDRSLVLTAQHGEVSFLLTGDIERAAEEQLLVGPVTVLKAPHHGSRTSSSPPFIARARPRHVVFCVARGGRFQFPAPEVERRYAESGARCWQTDLHGAIRFDSDGRNVRVTTFHPHPAKPKAAQVAAAEAPTQL